MADRRDAATAATGYGLVATGGAIRGKAIDDAHKEMGYGARRLRPSSLAVLQAKLNRTEGSARIARKFSAGTGLVAIGGPAAAVGTAALVRRHQVSKADKHQNILTEGAQGTSDALKQKASSIHSGAPAHVRATAITLGAAGAAGGSLLAHRGLDGVGKLVKVSSRVRSATTAAAAVPGALATLPASRRLSRRSGYTVTPTGTQKVLSKAAQQYKHNDYLGRHVAPGQQRVRVLAAGATPGPLVGPVAAAHQAGRYAPPGQSKRAAARQLAGGPVAGGVAGLYAGKKVGALAERSPRAESGVRRALGGVEHAHAKLPEKARKLVPLKTAANLTPKKAGAVAGFIAGHALVGAVGGQLATNRNLAAERKFNAHHPVSKSGFMDEYRAGIARAKEGRGLRHGGNGIGGKPLCGVHSLTSYNVKTEFGRKAVNCPRCLDKMVTMRVAKALGTTGMTDKQTGKLVRRKKFGATVGVASAGTGLTALSMIGSKVPATIERRNKLLAVGAGLSGVGALNSASVARREAKAEKSTIAKAWDPETRGWTPTKRALAEFGSDAKASVTVARSHRGRLVLVPSGDERLKKLRSHHKHEQAGRHYPQRTRMVNPQHAFQTVAKRQQPIQTSMDDKEAHHLVHGPGGYGIKGPLPSHLDRPTRMKAYEARYVASGGKKSQRWQHVAQGGQHVGTAGVAGATAAGLALIATKSPRAKALAAPLHKLKRFESMNSDRVKEKAEHAAVVSATAGGVGQLVNQGAKHQRGKYTSAPGGVAASNLRRMQQYTPGG